MEMRMGEMVTCQPDHWYDGEPVKGWPFPEYVGMIVRFTRIGGIWYARVKYGKGRYQYELISSLHIVVAR